MSEESKTIQNDVPNLNSAKKLIVEIPELCLVALIGASSSGKSTFARKHFKPTEVISSDACRAWVSDDELDQTATSDAFDVLYFIADKRLERGKLVVVDATNVQSNARKELVRAAKSQNVMAVAIVLNVRESVCLQRNASRVDRQIPPHAISRQCRDMRESLRSLEREGFRYVTVLKPEQMDNIEFVRTKLWPDKKHEHGPFDIIGDIHGCYEELSELLAKLGYLKNEHDVYFHPAYRRAIFLGDFVDRGPISIAVLDTVRSMVETGTAFAVPGNHDEKLLRWLIGKKPSLTHGLDETVRQIESIPAESLRDWKESTKRFLDGLVSHLVLDDGKLVVAHAGIAEKMQGRASGAVRSFCLFGDTTGEVDDEGYPVRRDWAANYRGSAAVVYGHTPQRDATWINNTINIDTGCVFGGSITALRWPEKELISVDSKQKYAEPSRNFSLGVKHAETSNALDLFLTDVYSTEAGGSGKLRISTRLMQTVLIEQENCAAALEIMSRFAVDPRWLVYLPPTMSPCETQESGDYLEHPSGAFRYFESQGISEIICQEKHMGSRAVIVICKDSDTTHRRFGIMTDGAIGECYTRTGRRFFNEPERTEFLTKVQSALTVSGFWSEHKTDWAVIDAEIMPWNAKAQGLLRDQYAPVGAAAIASLAELDDLLEAAKARGVEIDDTEIEQRRSAVAQYVDAYRAYCWTVNGLEGVKVAPFHLLATEGRCYADQPHEWHIAQLSRICDVDTTLFKKTACNLVNLSDPLSVQNGIEWWISKTAESAEGMVVKPKDFVTQVSRGLAQPAVKCRGREYLRIIYGPEYTLPRNLETLRARGLGRKRSLALREFALGIEGLERFAANAPLHKVHECAFSVLALESEPVDPRL